METAVPKEAAPGQASCPLLRPVKTDLVYPVKGICQGFPNGLPMIPTVEEYRMRCSSPSYTTCPIYRAQMGEDGFQALLQAEYQRWALHPLCGLA